MPEANAEPAYVAILRHGAYHQQPGAPSARQPHPLTEEGLSQARAAGAALAGIIAERGLTLSPVLYASRQLRAWQTAEEIRKVLTAQGHPALRIAETSDLAERGLGSAANMTVPQIEAALAADPRYAAPPPGWKSDSMYRLPLEGAESLMGAGQRVADHLRRSAVPGRLTIHAGHGASFRHACHHLGLLAQKEIAQLSMFHARPLLLCHDADGRWRHLAGAWKVRAPKEDPID